MKEKGYKSYLNQYDLRSRLQPQKYVLVQHGVLQVYYSKTILTFSTDILFKEEYYLIIATINTSHPVLLSKNPLNSKNEKQKIYKTL